MIYDPYAKTLFIDDTLPTSGCHAGFPFAYEVEEVYLPKGLKTIEPLAFNSFTALTKINFPETLETIGEAAFVGCKMREITLNEGIKEIGYRAFAKCGNLETIILPDSLETIEGRAFEGCRCLKDVSVNAKTQIGEDAFPSSCKVNFRGETQQVLNL